MNRALATELFPIDESLVSEDIWLGYGSEHVAQSVVERAEVVLEYRIHSGNSNPRHLEYAAMSKSLHARHRAWALLAESQLHLDDQARDDLRALWDAEQRRHAGHVFRTLRSPGVPLMQRIALASLANPRSYLLRNRFYPSSRGARDDDQLFAESERGAMIVLIALAFVAVWTVAGMANRRHDTFFSPLTVLGFAVFFYGLSIPLELYLRRQTTFGFMQASLAPETGRTIGLLSLAGFACAAATYTVVARTGRPIQEVRRALPPGAGRGPLLVFLAVSTLLLVTFFRGNLIAAQDYATNVSQTAGSTSYSLLVKGTFIAYGLFVFLRGIDSTSSHRNTLALVLPLMLWGIVSNDKDPILIAILAVGGSYVTRFERLKGVGTFLVGVVATLGGAVLGAIAFTVIRADTSLESESGHTSTGTASFWESTPRAHVCDGSRLGGVRNPAAGQVNRRGLLPVASREPLLGQTRGPRCDLRSRELSFLAPRHRLRLLADRRGVGQFRTGGRAARLRSDRRRSGPGAQRGATPNRRTRHTVHSSRTGADLRPICGVRGNARDLRGPHHDSGRVRCHRGRDAHHPTHLPSAVPRPDLDDSSDPSETAATGGVSASRRRPRSTQLNHLAAIHSTPKGP